MEKNLFRKTIRSPRAERQELFRAAQTRLTRRYSLLMGMFLLLLIGVVYILLYTLIWNEQKKGLDTLIGEEIKALQGPLWEELKADKFSRPGERPFPLSADQAFYYVADLEGDILYGAEIRPELREQAVALIRQEAFTDRPVMVQLQSRTDLHLQEGQTQTRSIAYLAEKRQVMRGGQLAGTLYIGKDVSFQQQLLGWLPAVLAGIALGFALIAAWLSRWMARQAILPLREAYLRQKRLTADTSHELRTPLSVLLASIEALELEEGVAGQAFASRLTARMKKEVQRMSRLTGDLLTLSRLDSGQEVFLNRSFNMADAAREAVAALAHLAGEKGVTLELEAEPELPVRLDREKVVQLLVILLENAVKYTPAGGKVRLQAVLNARRGEERVLLEVEDTGCGIAEEELALIFQRFYRPDLSRSRHAGGHGLGLAIAKQIADAYGGSIQARSVPGQGSVFTAELPRYAEE